MSAGFTPIEPAMRTRSVLSGGGESRGGSPWSDGHAAEMGGRAESRAASLRGHELREAEKELK